MRIRDIFYTCQASSGLSQSTLLYTTNLSGSLVRQFPVRDASDNLIPMHAIAWDSTEDLLWGVNQFPTGPSPFDAICAVWRVDTSHVVGGSGNGAYPATLAFTFSDTSLCKLNLKDTFITGLAVDGTMGTIYVSGQGGSLIRAFTKTGTPAPNDPIDFRKLTKAYCKSGCRTSGLAFGTSGQLMASAKLDARLFVIDPSGPTLQDVITSGSPRNWDLECGPLVYDAAGAPLRTVLAADLSSNFIQVIEAPSGFCNPVDVVTRNMRITPNPLILPRPEFGIVSVSFEALAFGGTPEEPLQAGYGIGAEGLERFHPFVRILAEPGDICSYNFYDWLVGPVYQVVKCAEGDAPGVPSIHGFAACYDGIDNDGDLLADFQDPDCTRQISHVSGPVTLSDTFQTITRYAAVRKGSCTNEALQFSAGGSHSLDTNFSNNRDSQVLILIANPC